MTYRKDDYLLIFTNIFFIKGYHRTMVLDFLKDDWAFISNEYFEIIKELKKKKISEVEKAIDYGSRAYFYEFIDFLLKEDYAVITDSLTSFPEIVEEWSTPYKITNSVIDINEKTRHDYAKIADELQKLGCQFIELRSYKKKTDFSELQNILQDLQGKDFRNIHLIIRYDKEISHLLQFLIKDNSNLSVTVYASPEDRFIEGELNEILQSIGYINFIKQEIIDCRNCGVINPTTLLHPTEVKKFMENKLFNSCLNKKISISANGEIKKCPSMKFSYGVFGKKTLTDVVNLESFLIYDKINKDQINICKDCEFRYVCSDCRAYTERTHFNEDGIDISKPLKCGYDPYSGNWQEWSSNPLKEKAIRFYGMRDIMSDNKN